jgi:putative transposase
MEDGIRTSIRKICMVRGVTRSNVYYREKTKKTFQHAAPMARVEEIRGVIEEYPEYGTRRITAVLRKRHKKAMNRKRIHKMVKEQGWQRWKRPSGNRPRVQGIQSVTPQANSRWAIDMTHIFTKRDGGCHLVAVIDCADRYLVGWRFSRSGNAGISAEALEDALIRENIMPNVQNLVIRSDNGLVFGSKRFHETLMTYHLSQEYITSYTPEQNGMIEQCFRSFKEECVWQHTFVSFDEAYNKIADWIDYYNFERPYYSALGYATLAEIRNKLVA